MINYKKEVFVDASIKGTVRASDKDAQYDEKAKKLLGHKIILAYILVNTIEEFRGMNPKEVVNHMEKEYDIPLENDIRKDVKEMCNLSQGIREEAFEEGQEQGEKQKLVKVVTKMYEAKFPLEQIAAIAEVSVENVKEIID